MPLALALMSASLAPALPTEKAERALEAARELIGVEYQLGGRMRRPGEGIDCQGLVFYALERLSPCGWRSFSTRPTDSVAWGEIGRPVPKLDPVTTEDLDIEKLRPGDVIRMVHFDRNPKEPPIGQIDGRPVWAWHSGLYAGEGNWIVGDHIAGEVVETPLLPYLWKNRESYVGVHVSRMVDGPSPKRCRHHAPMRR